MISLQNKELHKNILYIHGYASNKNSNKSLIQFCKENNYNLWTIDLPGHGEAQFGNIKLTIKSFSEFVINFININKIDKPIIIGHSMGGAIAASVASILNKNRVDKLILISPINLSIKNNKFNKSKNNLINYFESNNMHILEKLKKMDTINILKFTLLARNISTNSALNELDIIYRKLNIPTLILLGQNDLILPCPKSFNYFNDLKNNYIKIIIQNGDHSLYKTSEISFVKNVNSFINKV